MRKPEKTANLVFENGAYRIVEDYEMLLLKADGKVVFEKARQENGMYGYFYKRVA